MPNKIVLSDILTRGNNSFDLIRIFAAITVIFGHSFYLFKTGGYTEPVTLIVNKNFSGTLAVGTFFFLSGILVTQSFVRSNSPIRFVILRMARIYPGSLVFFWIMALLVGPIISHVNLNEYFESLNSVCRLYDKPSIVNFTLTASFHCGALPGVFTNNIIGPWINGSLWTLGAELACYAYVFVLGLLGMLNSPLRILISVSTILVVHSIFPRLVPYFSDDHYTDILKVGLFFMAGALSFAFRSLIVIRWSYALPLIVIAAFLQKTIVEEYALYLALFYLILVIAAAKGLSRIKLGGDYSYGVYVYGWPVQQIYNQIFPNMTSYPSNFLSIPTAIVLGYLSWHYVEKPILDAAHVFASKRIDLGKWSRIIFGKAE